MECRCSCVALGPLRRSRSEIEARLCPRKDVNKPFACERDFTYPLLAPSQSLLESEIFFKATSRRPDDIVSDPHHNDRTQI
jgi:hypothetical protein